MCRTSLANLGVNSTPVDHTLTGGLARSLSCSERVTAAHTFPRVTMDHIRGLTTRSAPQIGELPSYQVMLQPLDSQVWSRSTVHASVAAVY